MTGRSSHTPIEPSDLPCARAHVPYAQDCLHAPRCAAQPTCEWSPTAASSPSSPKADLGSVTSSLLGEAAVTEAIQRTGCQPPSSMRWSALCSRTARSSATLDSSPRRRLSWRRRISASSMRIATASSRATTSGWQCQGMISPGLARRSGAATPYGSPCELSSHPRPPSAARGAPTPAPLLLSQGPARCYVRGGRRRRDGPSDLR